MHAAMRMIRRGAQGPLLDENSKPIQFGLPTLLKFYGLKAKQKVSRQSMPEGAMGKIHNPSK